MTEGALDGLKIVEWGEMITAPYCGKLAADLGAEVIKIEPPGTGDNARHAGPFFQDVPGLDRSGLFLYLNTNKLSITLDPTTETGRQVFLDLIAEADVVLENQKVGFPESIGLGYDALHEINPRLIVVSISPFGATGPYRDYQATDLVVGQMAGLGYLQPGKEEGTVDMPPIRPGGRQADFGAGLTAAAAMMHALFQRSVSGEGSHVDVSSVEAAIAGDTTIIGPYLEKGTVEHRLPVGNTDGIGVGGYRLPCKDGYLVFQTGTYGEWQTFVDVMGNPEWTQDERFQELEARSECFLGVRPELWDWTRTQEKQKLYHATQRRRLTTFPVNTPEDIVNSEHLNERGFFVEVDHPETGPIKYPGAPAIMHGTPWAIRSAAPSLGQHNKEVLNGRLGRSLDDLTASQAI
jgi:CoA:oxalate CoA-transferase